MLKRIALVNIVASLLLLTACGPVLSDIYFNRDSNRADARLEQIIEAINSRDKEKLTSMFSEDALNEAENLSLRIDSLFDFVGGAIISWGDRAGNVSESASYGSRTTVSKYEYTINTEQAEFMLFIYETTENTENPSAVGVYMIQIYTPDDRSEVFDWGNEKKCAGINISN